MGLIEDFIAEHPKEMELAQMRRREVKKLLADYDKSLREQIAREILERVIGSVDTKGGFGEAFNQGIVTAAAIARGRNDTR